MDLHYFLFWLSLILMMDHRVWSETLMLNKHTQSNPEAIPSYYLMDCGNLISLIDTLHGREICFKSKKLELLRIRLLKKIADLAFLKLFFIYLLARLDLHYFSFWLSIILMMDHRVWSETLMLNKHTQSNPKEIGLLSNGLWKSDKFEELIL